MTINWPIVTVLFCLSIPGVTIAIKRLIYFLLPDNSETLKKRLSRFAILQTLFMVLILSIAGAFLSPITGLNAPILEALLQGARIQVIFPILLPSVLYSLFGLIAFFLLYYGVFAKIVDKNSLNIMTNLRLALGVDGCVLYGGVVEEVITRWGLLNLATYFALLFTNQYRNLVLWTSIFVSGLLFAVGQLPAYLAAGCASTRRFIYSFIALSLCQSLFFGYLFWQYGLIAAILTHMLFNLGWTSYENVKKS